MENRSKMSLECAVRTGHRVHIRRNTTPDHRGPHHGLPLNKPIGPPVSPVRLRSGVINTLALRLKEIIAPGGSYAPVIMSEPLHIEIDTEIQ